MPHTSRKTVSKGLTQQKKKRNLPAKARTRLADHSSALKASSSQIHSQPAKEHQSSFHSGQYRHQMYQASVSSIMKLLTLWVIALIIFALGLASIIRPHSLTVSNLSSSGPQQSESASVTVIPSHVIFRVNGIAITNTQWHDAVQSAFAARASSGEYFGGTQADTVAINTQALHTILDPLAEQELVKQFGLTTNVDILYQQWFSQASLQDQQAAQKSQNDASYKQQVAQKQIERDIVSKIEAILPPSVEEVYAYYQQHPDQFARTRPQMHLQQIMVTSPQTAQQVVKQLSQGVPFSTVEARYDESGSFYHTRGGDLGWVAVGGSGYPPEWNNAVLSLKAGQVGAPFQVDGRYFIVKCLEGPDYEQWPFSQVQDQATQDLTLEQLDDTFERILSQKEKTMQIILLDPQYGILLQRLEVILKSY